MASLYWQTIGAGKRDLVMLHGWGLNADVWQGMIPRLSAHFRLHLVDLTGYGRSHNFPALSLAEMVETVHREAPARAIWLGWSLGGLVATQMALTHADSVSRLITVASSPCFVARESWPGIKSETLQGFQHQMKMVFQRTVERFLALQTLGSATAREDTRHLRRAIQDWPMPSEAVLAGGLQLLSNEDLRAQLNNLAMPLLRIYGALDGLVPRRIVPLLDAQLPGSRSVVIAKAAHAPFISHAEQVCGEVTEFCCDE
ncbi:MAG: Pimeloyl-[acyl-carrier protein] methyl ester esterase [Candidatus Erwinia impunctatus]|nr:Pimeloyl-[acyl-carrier protein] methyl ester esterase [Culicoides impunctatus]